MRTTLTLLSLLTLVSVSGMNAFAHEDKACRDAIKECTGGDKTKWKDCHAQAVTAGTCKDHKHHHGMKDSGTAPGSTAPSAPAAPAAGGTSN
jgi:hypothetical protein